MNYYQIRREDVANGPGIRVSMFIQGCSIHCSNCFNKQTWDFSKGKKITDDVVNQFLQAGIPTHITGFSFLGGEPLDHVEKDSTLINIIKKIREHPTLTKKTIWMWTGYKYETLTKKQRKVVDLIDVLVDGQFDETKAHPHLNYRGSTNQRVIDLKETRRYKKIILDVTQTKL